MTNSTATPRRVNGVDVDALHQTIEAIRSQPELGAAKFHGTSRWLDDRRVSTSIDRFHAGGGKHKRPNSHELTTDLPEALLGTDRGGSPIELALSALSSCVTTTLVAHAAARGLELKSLGVTATGDLDLRGFLNLGDTPVGYQKLTLAIDLKGDIPAEETRSFIASALRFSPVLDLFRRATEVTVTQTDLDSAPQS